MVAREGFSIKIQLCLNLNEVKKHSLRKSPISLTTYTLTNFVVQKNIQGKLVGNQPLQAPMSYLLDVTWIFKTPQEN